MRNGKSLRGLGGDKNLKERYTHLSILSERPILVKE
jgi:hypothetical protein